MKPTENIHHSTSSVCLSLIAIYVVFSTIRMTSEFEQLKAHLSKNGQEHLLQFWDSLSPEERSNLLQEIRQINIEDVTKFFKQTQSCSTDEKLDDRMEPVPEENCGSYLRSNPLQLQKFEDLGLNLIREGKVALLLLAGGQGTRLGVNYPKGMYDVGLPSRKTLFQLQAERLRRLQTMSSASSNSGVSGSIPWYIMTSEGTKEPTQLFFERNHFFGLEPENVQVFEQGMLPCFDFDGKIILESKHKISKAPDGNGGLYKALRDKGIIQDMKSRGIEHIHVYCVDNILVKVADPAFIGYCVQKGADCGAKVVEKITPTEAVGVFCKVDGNYQVVEYSEITEKTAEKRHPVDDRLLFNAGNICNHYFTTEFLDKVTSGLDDTLIHHIAKKKIPCVDSNGVQNNPETPNGIKLEKFVFDVFRFSKNFAVWEVPREDEFSPLKNSDSASKDTPTTCRNDLYTLHRRYLAQAGATFEISKQDCNNNDLEINNNSSPVDVTVEISPLISYAGEDLVKVVEKSNGKFALPVYIAASNETYKSYTTLPTIPIHSHI